MGDWIVTDTTRGNQRECDSRAEAEERKSDMVSLGASPEDIEISPPSEDVEPEIVDHSEDAKADGGEVQTGGVDSADGSLIDSEGSEPTPEDMEADPDIITGVDDLEQEKTNGYNLDNRSVSDDPLQWVPGEFVDNIDGTQAINRKGFAVLGHFYEIETSSEVIVPPEETDFEFCRVKAVATTKDGREYEAHGSAHVDRGDDSYLLLEMADTRAKKRSLADSTGVGAVAVAELKNEVTE